MLAARRASHLLRSCKSQGLHGFVPRLREYHGDPGPSTQKSLRSALTSLPGKGRHLPKKLVNADKELLNVLMTNGPVDTPNRPRPSRQVSLPLRLPTSVPDRRGRENGGISRYESRIRDKDIRDNPYTTSTKLKRFIEKHTKNKSMTENQIEEAVSIVMNAPKDLVNAPVWNILLGFMGKQRKLNKMWALYNDMKKRGIKPTTRTYSTLLNAYSRMSHADDTAFNSDIIPVKNLTHSRVTILHDQAQQHVKRCMTASSLLNEDLGISTSEGEILTNRNESFNEFEEEINISPTNAYLKYLGRHGLWEEMYTTFISMPQQGQLSPDKVTYTTLFSSLHNIHLARWRSRKSGSTDSEDLKLIDIGSISRGIWDQCSRQFYKSSNINSKDQDRRIDNELFNHALRCLIKGRPEDLRLAIKLVNEIWSLPPPSGQSYINESVSDLPKLQPDVQSATSLIQGLLYTKQSVPAAHYTTLFLSDSRIEQEADIHFLKIAISAFSETGDIGGITNILDSYQPPSTGIGGWHLNTWKDALQGARWSSDFNTALRLFKRATQISDKIENNSPMVTNRDIGEYEWTTPNGQSKDIRGVNWIKPRAISPDIGMLAILLKSAISTNNEAIKKVLNIITYFGGERLFVVDSKETHRSDKEKITLIDHTPQTINLNYESPKYLGSIIDFAKSIISSIERLNPTNKFEYENLRKNIQNILDVWSKEFGKFRKGHGLLKEVSDTKQIEQEDVIAYQGQSPRRKVAEEEIWSDEDDSTPSRSFRRNDRSSKYNLERNSFDRQSTRRNEDDWRDRDRSGRKDEKIFLRGRNRHFDDGLNDRSNGIRTSVGDQQSGGRERLRRGKDFGEDLRSKKTSFDTSDKFIKKQSSIRKTGFGLKRSDN
ncbi:uncharacterized protein I206_100315 [Kwoniella pini CBS 10737]|uniref:Pentatricopeptide repeat domain-containing protein n=1 Tax=Kwoniella pini CBS 10737 TaxID=1296096 RepID=A0A1B9IE52_9TREE|nr:uncharacterized protein I206_01010 [Kwoniella pini CBS 10737]OCF53704.1 hypothetical protein I206_01010 [Kwoniella pini CBS 10737]